MIRVPGKGRLTLAKAFELLSELDWYAGHRAGAGANPVPCVEKTRETLREHIAHSLGLRDARAEGRAKS